MAETLSSQPNSAAIAAAPTPLTQEVSSMSLLQASAPVEPSSTLAPAPAPTPTVVPLAVPTSSAVTYSEAAANAPVPEPIADSTPEPTAEQAERVELDPVFLSFVLSAHYRASQVAVKKDFSLTDEEALMISDLDRLVMAGKMNLEGYLLSLEEELSERLSQEDRDRLYAQLLAERFVPLEDRVKPTAVEVARDEGITLPPVARYRLYEKPLTYSGAATEIAATAGFSLMGGPLRERLRELVMSRAKGVRVESQVREALLRGLDAGGLGLDPVAADKTIAAMTDITSRARLMSEDEYANFLADQAHHSAAPVATVVPSPAPIAAPVDPDAAEIAAIQAKTPTNTAATALEKAIETTYATIGFATQDEYLSRRLRNVISSRLRSVRNQLEVKQLFMRDTKVGGLGLDVTKADELTKKIEEAYQQFHEAIANEEKGKIGVQLEEQKRKIEDRRKREAADHAKWFEEKIRSRKTDDSQTTQAFEGMRRIMGGATTPIQPAAHPLDAKEERVEAAKFGPLVPVPAPATTAPIALVKKGAPVLAPAPTPIKVSPASAKIAQEKLTTRPSMDGMTYGGPALVGLTGELKSLTVAEFRRLSKNPQEASTKIRQKIETLGQESFDRRVEGIQAFQASPLQGAYLALVGESFRSMKPVAALAEEKRKAGSETLSADEIGAIMALNSALHF